MKSRIDGGWGIGAQPYGGRVEPGARLERGCAGLPQPGPVVPEQVQQPADPGRREELLIAPDADPFSLAVRGSEGAPAHVPSDLVSC